MIREIKNYKKQEIMAFNYRGYKWQVAMRRNLYGAIGELSGKNTGSTENSCNSEESSEY